ncbi:MAG: sodium:calcium antiporter [Deltaproteobacteria bacterium]|nr:sodium:calcium antiporter [Deltaproteobacteria bacterium]MBW1948076.1 sodium:calcium antiporter [Deltaproteobacteria bacterium]MBW2006501.1 sodium:calcium antiporter [Deltaproteobacteria bacterium]
MYEIFRWLADETLLHDLVGRFPAWLLLVFIAACIVLLSKGANTMIDGVVQLARRTGLPRIVVGATIVSLGTTMPEAFVSVMAAWMGNPGLALGNGVGSIIADTGLIFGLSCVLAPIPVNRYILNRTGWVQVGAATLLVLISMAALFYSDEGPLLGRGVGFFFLFLLAGYLYVTYRWARGGPSGMEKEDTSPLVGRWRAWAMILGGLMGVVAGARVLIPCAAELAVRMGVPDDVIAATMVALGTSLPELMTAVAAIRKGHPEITVGNIVGADVLNCLFVIGAAAAARPLSIPANFYSFHFPAMLIILYSFRFFIFRNRQGRFKRWQGGWLLSVYGIYLFLQYAFNIGSPPG